MADDKTKARIKELEEELQKTKYNKRTQHHIGLVKAKIAALKQKIVKGASKKGLTYGYSVKKSGDATVVLIGYPSVGKSTLLNALTNAESKVAAYDFTTLTVIPGLMEYNHAKIQILDVPGIIQGAADGSGRGREVLAVVRNSDLVMILLDINDMHQLNAIRRELDAAGIRLNQEKPDIIIRKTAKDGIRIGSTVNIELKDETIKSILNEFKIINAEVLIRSKITEDQLIDCIEQNKIYIPSVLIINKCDLATEDKIDGIKKLYPDAVIISAETKINLEQLKREIFNKLEFTRIFLKQPGKKPDMDEPLVLRKNATLQDLCLKIHKDFILKFKFARIWGKSVKYDGQRITKINKGLRDQDIVELHTL